MAKDHKGSKVDLLTFKKWGKDNVIGYKVEKVNGRELVNFVWCKVCARNKDALLTHPNCKGTVKKSVMHMSMEQTTSLNTMSLGTLKERVIELP